jgi:hypothetical protein
VGLPSADVRTKGIIEGLNIMGYAGVMLGERELAGGYEEFLKLREQAKFPFVSANFIFEDDRSPLVDPWVIHTVGTGESKLRIGIIGLNRYNTAFLRATADGRNIIVASPGKVAREMVPKVAEASDLVILLTSLSISQARQLTGEVQGIDVIIGANGGVQSRLEDVSSGVPIVYTGSEGKNLSEVRLIVSADPATPHKVKRSTHYLTRDYPQEPELQMLTQEVLSKENSINRNLAVVEVERPVIPDTVATYVGSESCGSCHESALHAWLQSSHATAFESLVTKEQDFNQECVGCHSVGFGRKDGFVNAKATPELINVQCESCHGPGSLHIKDTGTRYGSAGARSCIGCHDPENSPEFDFYIFWPRIRH